MGQIIKCLWLIHSVSRLHYYQGNVLKFLCANFSLQNKFALPYQKFFFVILLLGLYPKNPESPIQKNLYTPMFIAAQFTIAKCSKQPKCTSVDEWIKKLWYVYTMEYYAAERTDSYLSQQNVWNWRALC